jgi:hypothetical protein
MTRRLNHECRSDRFGVLGWVQVQAKILKRLCGMDRKCRQNSGAGGKKGAMNRLFVQFR